MKRSRLDFQPIVFLLFTMLIGGIGTQQMVAQNTQVSIDEEYVFGEPEVEGYDISRNLYDEGFRSGLGFRIGLNDFGLQLGAQYRRALRPYTEGLISLSISGVRDPSEQTYIDYYFGNRVVPSKYKRVLSTPLNLGLKQRFFPDQITDNFRVHASMSVGGAMMFALPYFDDYNSNGFREANINEFSLYEPVNDVFEGWNQLETELAFTGEWVLGIDFGDNFAQLQSFQFGYTFYYMPTGIQIMEPFKPIRENGIIVDVDQDQVPDGYERANDVVNYLGSVQITFVFGKMWGRN
ncbi:MAG: hypothetical protein VW868_01155 [Bacteroidota bacterium]